MNTLLKRQFTLFLIMMGATLGVLFYFSSARTSLNHLLGQSPVITATSTPLTQKTSTLTSTSTSSVQRVSNLGNASSSIPTSTSSTSASF